MSKDTRTYIAIDLKSFYASVECVDRGLDPLNTNLLVDEDKVQVEFYCNDKLYLGQYVVGMVENPSGLKGLFENVETVTLSDENVTFEYPTPEEKTSASASQAGSKKQALAQTYVAETNITAWLVDNDFSDLDDFKAVTELFLNALD